MRPSIWTAAALVMGAVAGGVSAANQATQGDYLIARQGKAEVWAIDVDAHLQTMPEQDRAAFIDSPKRIQQLLSHLLLRRNLAIEARELGLDQDPVVQRELLQAAEVVLMRHRLNHLREHVEVPDLEPLAKEKFLAEREKYRTKELVTVAHVLLNTQSRTEEQAIAQLKQWKADIEAGKTTIEALAKEYSDDPSAAANGGLFENYDPDNFVPEFANAVRGLDEIGELSEPVKTQFGYHLIQLRARTPARPYEWDEIKDQLIAAERETFIRKQVAAHVEKLKTLPVEASEESVAPLRERYGKIGVAGNEPAAQVQAPPTASNAAN